MQIFLCEDIIDNIMSHYNESFKISKRYYLIDLKKKKKALRKIIYFLKEIKKERKRFKYITLGNFYNLSKKDLIKRIIFNYKKEVFCGYPDIIVGAFCLDVKLLNFLPDSNNRKIYDLYKFLKQHEISEEILKEARY